MKKYYFFLFAAFCIATSSKAAPGDTTWVQANIDTLTYFNNYDTTVNFPAPSSVTYRKIYMIFTLGKYMCPGYGTTTEYCGDWDYTVQNFLMTPGGDTVEIARLITPYANNAAPRTPWTWTQPYVYDVTDFASLLQNSATMRIFYSGYSGGFTANIKFMFIEGTPDRTVKGIQPLWNGSYSYGDTAGGDSNDINTHFTALSGTPPAGTQTTDLKFTVTGHGADVNDCCEFVAHNYKVMYNSSSIYTQTVWRDNCGENELYPQSGTWLLERANWCPGGYVYPYFYTLPATVGTPFNIGLDFDAYVGGGGSGYGSYTTFGTLIYYGGINKTLDASIEEIIAPSNDENYFRENPRIGSPTLHIRNSGQTVIDSVKFQYGVQDSAMQTYTWVGTLNPLQDTEINLAALATLSNIAGVSGTYNFIAEILSVNGVTDNDQTNDTMRSQFVAGPKWPSSFRILMITSNINDSTDPSIAETSWVLYDLNNNIVRERTHLGFNVLYTDTLNLPTGYYKLAIINTPYSDGEYYGLNWWALAGAGYTPGSFRVENLSPSTLIPMNGYSYTGTYNNDFGQGFTQYFYVVDTSTAVNTVNASSLAISAFPNPAQNLVNVAISGMPNVSGKIEIIDMQGRVVSVTATNSTSQQINVSQLVSGVYTILFVDNTNDNNRLETKLLITK